MIRSLKLEEFLQKIYNFTTFNYIGSFFKTFS